MTMFVIIYFIIGWVTMFSVCKELAKDGPHPRLDFALAFLLLLTIIFWPVPIAYYFYERFFFLTR